MLANVGAIVLALIIISVTGHEDCFPMKKWKVDQAITRALRKAADGYGVGSVSCFVVNSFRQNSILNRLNFYQTLFQFVIFALLMIFLEVENIYNWSLSGEFIISQF